MSKTFGVISKTAIESIFKKVLVIQN